MKKILCLVLAIVMLFAFAACGAKKEESAAPAEKEEAAAPAEKEEAAAPAEKEEEESKGGYRIAFSNAYVGNSWRAQTQKIFEAYAEKLKAKGIISEYFVTSAGQDDQSQINEIRNLMSEGYDAILVNASSPTALVPVLEEAVERGIVVVAFDNTVDSDQVYNVNCDQVELGEIQAKWLMEKLGNKGNVAIIAGIEGTTVSRDRCQGYYNVIQQYIDSGDVKVLATEYGKWDTAATSIAINNLLSAYGDQIDGILYEGGGEIAIYEALTQNNIDPADMPFTGEFGNGWWRLMATEGVSGVAAGDPPYLSASAIDVAVKILNGEEVERQTWVPVPHGTEADADKYYAPDLPDEFFVDWTDAENSFGLTLEEVIPDK